MGGKNVELGTVGFNLEANDPSLQRSLETLKKFGQEVNRASNLTDEAGQRMYAKLVQVERAVSTVFDRVSGLTDGLRKAGASADVIEKLTTQYDALANAMIKAGKGVEPHEFVRNSVGMNAAVSQGTRALKEQAEATAFAEARQNKLVDAWERTQNLQNRMTRAGASSTDTQRIAQVYNEYSAALHGSANNMDDLRVATRAYKMALGEVTREIQANVAAANAAERQQARLIQATRNTAYVNARAARMNLPTSMTDANSGALQGLGSALQGGDAHAIVNAQRRLNDSLMATRMAMIGAEAPVSRLSLAMHDLSRATVLALGPLSGIGARIQVVTALLDSNSIQVALAIGGFVAMSAGLYSVSAAAIKATTAQEQFNAQLITTTGSNMLVAKEYEYLLSTANRLGIEVQGLVKPYADFGASARLSGMSLETQRKVFEAITTTGTALRWSTEQQGRAFLALTQMISKTKVMSEEYKKQLGELIPNIIGLGAEAEKTSTQGLFKMMSDSKLLATEHLPKLAEVLLKTFGPAAQEGMKTVSAEQNRLANSVFEAAKAFDKSSGVSEIYRKALVQLTAAMDYLKQNMDSVLGAMAAIAGAGAGMLFMRFLTAVPGLAAAAAASLMSLSTGIMALEALTLTTVVGWVLKLGAAIAGAALAWDYFKGKKEEALGAQSDFNKKMADWIDLQQKAGGAQKQTHGEMAKLAAERLAALDAELAKNDELIRNGERVMQSRRQQLDLGKELFGKRSPLRNSSEQLGEDPEVVKSRKRREAVIAERNELVAMMDTMAKMKVLPDPLAGLDDKKHKADPWVHWAKRVQEAIDKAQGREAEYRAFQQGDDSALKTEQAMTKAKALLADMPKQDPRIKQIQESLQKAGYDGATLVEQFQKMYAAEAAAEDKIKDIKKATEDTRKAGEAVADIWDKLVARRAAIEGSVAGIKPEDAQAAKQLAGDLQKLEEHYRSLGFAGEGLVQLLKEYSDEWKRIKGLEDHEKDVKRVEAELDRMGLKAGETADKIAAQHQRNVAIIEEAVSLGVRSRMEGDQLIVRSSEDSFRKMIEGGNIYYKTLHKTLNSVEDSLVDAFTSGASGGLSALSNMLNQAAMEITAFIIRMAIVKPAMAQLFGSMYTGSPSSGSGWLGGLMQTGINWMMGGTPLAGGTGFGDYNAVAALAGARAGGGDVNPYGEYLVGEHGPEILRMGNRPGTILNADDVRKQQQQQQVVPEPTVQYITNHFHLSGPTDRRTQQQLAATAGRSLQQAANRNG